jgi:hypothetical protein
LLGDLAVAIGVELTDQKIAAAILRVAPPAELRRDRRCRRRQPSMQ